MTSPIHVGETSSASAEKGTTVSPPSSQSCSGLPPRIGFGGENEVKISYNFGDFDKRFWCTILPVVVIPVFLCVAVVLCLSRSGNCEIGERGLKAMKLIGIKLEDIPNGMQIKSISLKGNFNTATVCKKFDEMTLEDGSTYTGDWENDMMHGQGTKTYPDETSYTGDWENDMMHGQGTKTYPDETSYTGDWENDMMHGQGTMTYQDGTSYEGDWKDGVKHGKGTMTEQNGTSYTGDWKDGMKHGKGIVTDENGAMQVVICTNDKVAEYKYYIGQREDGLKHGQGAETYQNGCTYSGAWEYDMIHGQGTMTYPDGVTFTGNRENGTTLMHGIGTMTCPNGSNYTGTWKNGFMDGQGTMTYPDERTYTGDWEDDKMHGKGIVTDENGARRVVICENNTVALSLDYIGQRANGKKHGHGAMTYPNGCTYTGTWKNGMMHGIGTMTYPNGSTDTGTCKNDMMHGIGTRTYPNGSTYSGNWKDGVKHGEGIIIYPDGATDVGKWKDGVKHGEGIMIYPDGMKVEFEYDNGELKTSNITDAHKERFFRMLVSDSSIKGGFWSRTTHQILSDLLGEIKTTEPCEDQMIPLVAEFKTINEYLESKAGFDPCILDVTRGGHAFLMKIEKPDEDNVQLVLIDSSSSNSPSGESQKCQSCRIFKLTDQGNLEPLLRDLQAKKNRKEFTECLQKSSFVTEEPTERPVLQRTQKIGNCSVKCWLALLRYELWKDHPADWESRWHTLKANLFTKASEFFETRLEGETDPIRKKCMERSIQLANDKITKRREKLE